MQAAIEHWAPRFITMGVDYNDFVRTTARIERWEQWLDAWCALADEHIALARKAEAGGRERSAGEAYLHAAVCLHFGKFVWMLDAAAHRAATERSFRLVGTYWPAIHLIGNVTTAVVLLYGGFRVMNGDMQIEPDEYVLVSFTNPTNAFLGGYYGLGVGTITNDD